MISKLPQCDFALGIDNFFERDPVVSDLSWRDANSLAIKTCGLGRFSQRGRPHAWTEVHRSKPCRMQDCHSGCHDPNSRFKPHKPTRRKADWEPKKNGLEGNSKPFWFHSNLMDSTNQPIPFEDHSGASMCSSLAAIRNLSSARASI